MRRRNLLGNKSNLTLSANSYSASPAASTQYVYAYYGGNAITNLTTNMISNSNTSLMTFSVDLSGRITVSIKSQKGNTSSRTGTLTLTYSGQQQAYTVTQVADYITSSSKTKSREMLWNSISFPSSVSVTTNGNIATTSQDFQIGFEENQYTITTNNYASGYISTDEELERTLITSEYYYAGAVSYDWTSWKYDSLSKKYYVSETVDTTKTVNNIAKQNALFFVEVNSGYVDVALDPTEVPPSTTTPPTTVSFKNVSSRW